MTQEAKNSRENTADNPYALYPQAFIDRLLDLDQGRIKEMDAGSVSLQVI